MTHWKLTLAYDGTPYHGWQVQPGLPTIQGALADAIHHTTGERVLPQGSGRTDAGVHALAQVASFALDAPIPPDRLHRALNRCLPPSIRILTAEHAPPEFHARHSALRKTYEYRIFPLMPPGRVPHVRRVQRLTWEVDPPASQDGRVPHSSRPYRDEWDVNSPPNPVSTHPERICPPTLAPYVWPCPWPLSLETLNHAAAHILGTHDFTTFAATDPDRSTRDNESAPEPGGPSFAGLPQRMGYSRPARTALLDQPLSPTPIRTIHHSLWRIHEDLLVYTVTGSGFLHHMVRNLVGTFVQAGSNRLSPDAIPTLIATRNRAVCGPTAPATGLFLVSVEYPDSTGNPQPATFSSL